MLLPGESHGQRSLEGCSPWGLKEPDTADATERAPTYIEVNEAVLSEHSRVVWVFFCDPESL